jgi:thioredoxin 2
MHIVCPSCGTTNRVPDAKLHDSPVCGRCGTQLMQTVPVNLNDASLPKFVERTELPVVVDFWADWCGPCKMMAPHFETAARELPDVRFVKVDSDASPQSSARYGIRSIPTLIVFRNGNEVARQSGAMQATELKRWLQSRIGQQAA